MTGFKVWAFMANVAIWSSIYILNLDMSSFGRRKFTFEKDSWLLRPLPFEDQTRMIFIPQNESEHLWAIWRLTLHRIMPEGPNLSKVLSRVPSLSLNGNNLVWTRSSSDLVSHISQFHSQQCQHVSMSFYMHSACHYHVILWRTCDGPVGKPWW